MILKSLIAPCTFEDLVEYSNFSQSVLKYVVNSGTKGENLNVSLVTSNISYSPI